MNTTQRSINELKRAGLFDKDSDYEGMIGNCVEELLKVFQKQRHSGFSAHLTAHLFKKLVDGEVLSPLTQNTDEWRETGDGCYQNKRCFSVFSDDPISGKARTIEGILFCDKKGMTFTGSKSCIEFDLPGFPPEQIIIKEGTPEAEEFKEIF